MAHSFVAYIDESGDEGFVFKDYPDKASSQWFVLSALICRADEEMTELRKLDAVIKPIEKVRNSVIHFHKLPHEQRVALCAALGESGFTFATINADKPEIKSAHLKKVPNLYFYMTRYLLERLSWLARKAHEKGRGDGRIKIVFSNRSRMSYDDLRSYVDKLRDKQTSIYWPAIDPKLIVTKTHQDMVGLRAADVLASGVRWGLELSAYGLCEDRYVRLMAPRCYSHGDAFRSYGMKFFPEAPAVEVARDNRYAWIEHHFPK